MASCSVSPTSTSTCRLWIFSISLTSLILFCDFLLWMGLHGRFSLHPHDRKGSIRVPVRAREQAATVRQRKSVPSPARRGRSDGTSAGIERAALVGEINSSLHSLESPRGCPPEAEWPDSLTFWCIAPWRSCRGRR